MVITMGPQQQNGLVPLSASFEAPGDAGSNVVLSLALSDVIAGFAGLARLGTAQQAQAWSHIVPASAAFSAALAGVGLRSPATPLEVTTIMTALMAVPPELIATLRLGSADGQALLGNQPGAADKLRQLVGLLEEKSMTSVLPLATNTGEALLVCSVARLQGPATVLNDLPGLSFRWYRIPISKQGGNLLSKLGSRNQFRKGAGLALVLAVGYARKDRLDPRGIVEPYAVRADLPPGQVLSLGEYEWVMNLLDRLHPIGMVMNTRALRQSHIDLDGNGQAEPMPSRLSRTFRPYRQRRRLGAEGLTLED
jgi:hypothetical protein